MPDNNIQNELKLQRLGSRINAGAFDDEKRKKLIIELENLIYSSLFLTKDKDRKLKWAKVLPFISETELEELKDVIIRENLRYKTGERKIKFTKNKKPKTNKDIKLPNIDFTQPIETQENKEELDNLSLELILAISEAFEKTDPDEFSQTKLKLKINPIGFSDILSQRSRLVLEKINEALKTKNKWQIFLKKDWPLFVETAAKSFLLAKQAESEITKVKNIYPQVNITSEEIMNFYNQIA